jgi:hypothetical protein
MTSGAVSVSSMTSLLQVRVLIDCYFAHADLTSPPPSRPFVIALNVLFPVWGSPDWLSNFAYYDVTPPPFPQGAS